ncbi:MAG: hypothetical protein ACFFCS_18950, partial [Candidatus Hodarchaeota archaeon]
NVEVTNLMSYLDKLTKILGPYWGVCIQESSEHENEEMEMDTALVGRIFCGDCGSKDIVQVFKDSGGTIAGGDTTWEVKCRSCGKFTHVWHEWG